MPQTNDFTSIYGLPFGLEDSKDIVCCAYESW